MSLDPARMNRRLQRYFSLYGRELALIQGARAIVAVD
jgi:hypothetical protein